MRMCVAGGAPASTTQLTTARCTPPAGQAPGRPRLHLVAAAQRRTPCLCFTRPDPLRRRVRRRLSLARSNTSRRGIVHARGCTPMGLVAGLCSFLSWTLNNLPIWAAGRLNPRVVHGPPWPPFGYATA